MMQHILLTLMFVLGGRVEQSDDYLSLRKASLAEYATGRFSEAETLSYKALRSAEKADDKYAVAAAYSALGDIYHAQLRFAEAERVYQKALTIFGDLPGQSHALAIVWRNMAGVLTAQMRFNAAAEALNRASKFLVKGQVKDPHLHALILNGSGVVQFYQGKTKKAKASFLRATEFQLRPATPWDLDLGDVLNNLGRVYQTKRQYAKAEEAYLRSLELITQRLGATHPNLATPLDNVGSLYREMGRYKEAEEHLRRSLAIEEEAAKPIDEAAVMHTLHELGKAYIGLNDKVRAEAVLARASEIARKRVLAREMPEASDVLETYSAFLKESSNPADAQRLHREAQRIRATLAFTVPLANAK
jgi:tetratricopeptide (TPR) repeat protein